MKNIFTLFKQFSTLYRVTMYSDLIGGSFHKAIKPILRHFYIAYTFGTNRIPIEILEREVGKKFPKAFATIGHLRCVV